ncbi:MAG: O-antigen ligase family protein [Flavobacteriales bacterium]
MSRTSREHRWIYLFALAVIAVGLPFGKAIISIGEIILVANFIWEGRWSERLSRIKSDPTIWLFVGFYLLHIIGLAWTSNFDWAFKDLRVKLPLLIFPIIVPLSQRLTRSEFLWIAAFFSGAVIVASFFSTYEFFIHRNEPDFDFRQISLFTSHIRYSLMVCLSFIILLNCAWNEEKQMWLRVAYTILAVWMGVFVFVLQSMTGIVIWLLCSYMLLFYTMFYVKNLIVRTAGTTALIVTPLLIIFYVAFQIDSFYPDEPFDRTTLEMQSAQGKWYHHDTNNLTLENGHYINLYISPLELQAEWNKNSDIKYVGGKDKKGQYVYTTLIRYMTSKGLRKDSVGFSSLTQTDIVAIENGVANVRFLYGNAIDNRVYTIIWELDKMVNEKLVQGHSVTQRFEYWKAGWQLFTQHFWLGVGTGDLDDAFDETYAQNHSKLTDHHRLRTHNQYLSIGGLPGIIGFLCFSWR